ncbi:MAG: hypothetical protein IPK62_00930 [Bacteroidetes bacterium]|nr:hypothetical protein [Bacteroidota bacterium]
MEESYRLNRPNRPQGISGLNGNTLLSGAAAPTVLDGVDGDYFMDTLAHHLYGPKTLGAWGSPTSLIGPSGPTGPAGSDAQVATTWADIATLKTQGLLIPGFVYKITDLQNIELVAKTTNTFHRIPYKRTIQGIEYDDELFDFDSKVLTGIDNIGCSARCSNGVWSIINDGSHEPYKMTTASNNLMVYFGKTYDKVISASTDLDEAYSGSNFLIDCGASVAFSYMAIWFYKTTIVGATFQKTQMTLQEASISGSNVFIMVKMSKSIQL